MEKIFDQAKDKNVAVYVVYGKTSDSKLYAEADYKTQITQAELEDAFLKDRLVIVNGSDTLVPVKLTGNKVLTIGYASSAVTGKEWEAKATV